MLPSTSTNTYDLTRILNKKKIKTSVTIPELHSEIKTLKQTQHKDSAILQILLSKIENQLDTESEPEDQNPESHALHDINVDQIDNDFLHVLTQISSKKYLIKISLLFSNDYAHGIMITIYKTSFDPQIKS